MAAKKGDLYRVQVQEKVRYFQYIEDDKSQLGSNLICVFKGDFSASANPAFADLMATGVDFFAHVLLKAGEKMKIWWKYQTSQDVCPVADIWFRDVAHSGNLTSDVSENWVLWRANQVRLPAKGKSVELLASHLGIVISPDQILKRIESGKFQFVYPRFPGQMLK